MKANVGASWLPGPCVWFARALIKIHEIFANTRDPSRSLGAAGMGLDSALHLDGWTSKSMSNRLENQMLQTSWRSPFSNHIFVTNDGHVFPCFWCFDNLKCSWIMKAFQNDSKKRFQVSIFDRWQSSWRGLKYLPRRRQGLHPCFTEIGAV